MDYINAIINELSDQVGQLRTRSVIFYHYFLGNNGTTNVEVR